MSRCYSKKKKLSVYLKFNESWFDLFISLGDHCWRQVIIRRRSSRAFIGSSMKIASICLHLEEIIIGVKFLFEEEVAER